MWERFHTQTTFVNGCKKCVSQKQCGLVQASGHGAEQGYGQKHAQGTRAGWVMAIESSSGWPGEIEALERHRVNQKEVKTQTHKRL